MPIYDKYEEIQNQTYYPDYNGLYKPIVFLPPNKEFPPKKSIYDSNCIEFWKYITENEVPYIDEGRYMVSSKGHTWDNFLDKKISGTCAPGNGYYVQLDLHTSKGQRVVVKLHRIIMMLFDPIDNPQLYQVNHKDTVHHNNDISNLEWCTDAYNRYHGILNDAGSNIFGDQIVILYPEEVHRIKELKDAGYSNQQVADMINAKRYCGAHKKLISRISLGQSKMYSMYYN